MAKSKRASSKRKLPLPCLNLVQNPSFEQGFDSWEYFGDIALVGFLAFEGAQMIKMSPNPGSLWQDVSLDGVKGYPLLLSFNLRGSEVTSNVPPPHLLVEVAWLDITGRIIGYGTRMYLEPGSATGNENERVTYFEITDRPPEQAALARVLFSKREGNEASFIQLDQVILAPVLTPNLLKNSGFEIGLNHWTTETFDTEFGFPLEGALAAQADEPNSTLFQDVSITSQPRGSSYLVGFSLRTTERIETNVQILWLNRYDAIIGPPGFILAVPENTLQNQGGYLTYLGLTTPAPAGAVRARVLFNAVEPLNIDQVWLIRVATSNLISNSGFESGLDFWTSSNVDVPSTNDAYEGVRYAALEAGEFIYQDALLKKAPGHCFLFSFALRARSDYLNGLAKVIWLDQTGNEIGLGLSLVAQTLDSEGDPFKWLVYAGVTESAPRGAVAARLQFAHTNDAGSAAMMDIDHVLFCRLLN